ncbi:hypothetical protein IKI14_00275 [bacterium]|nr:hypothetical protein [bacterium]
MSRVFTLNQSLSLTSQMVLIWSGVKIFNFSKSNAWILIHKSFLMCLMFSICPGVMVMSFNQTILFAYTSIQSLLLMYLMFSICFVVNIKSFIFAFAKYSLL